MENKYNINKKKPLDKKTIESHMDFNAILSQSTPSTNGSRPKTKVISLIGSALVTTAAAGLLLFFFRNASDDLDYIHVQQQMLANLEQPFQDKDVPYDEYEIDLSDKVDTIYFSTGSSAIIPNEAFVDQTGTPVKGKVQLTYRELNTNKEMIIAGVLKESSENSNFQSAGMIEITGEKDGKPIYFNEGHEIKIQLQSVLDHQFVDDTYLSYHLQENRWEEQGQDRIEKLSAGIAEADLDDLFDQIAQEQIASKPVRPIQPGDVPDDFQVFDFDINKADYAALQSLNDDVEFLVRKKDLKSDPFAVEWNGMDVRKIKDNQYEIILSQIDENQQISNSQKLTIYPYRNYSEAAQKAYEFSLSKYDSDQQKWEEKIHDIVMVRSGSTKGQDQIMNHFTIDRFGLWNCAKEISADNMGDQITDFKLAENDFVPERVYVFNNQYAVYMSKEVDVYNNYFRLDDEQTRILAKDKSGNMFVCDQKSADKTGFTLVFKPVVGISNEELLDVFGEVG